MKNMSYYISVYKKKMCATCINRKKCKQELVKCLKVFEYYQDKTLTTVYKCSRAGV
jgi:hypothetical protein